MNVFNVHQLTISTSYIDRIKKNCVQNNLKTRRRAISLGYCHIAAAHKYFSGMQPPAFILALASMGKLGFS